MEKRCKIPKDLILFQTYHDLYLPKKERGNRMREGVSSDNIQKLRTNDGDKDTSQRVGDVVPGVVVWPL